MKTGIPVFPLTDRLRRAAYIERLSIKHLSGWFVAAPKYEMKYQFGYDVWTHAEHTQWLFDRLHHLRGGHPSASIAPGLVSLVDHTLHAPNEYAYIRGAYQVLKKALLDFYESTLEACDPAANASDRRLLKRIIPEIQEQVAWSEDALREDPDPSVSQAWAQHIQDQLDALGGLDGDGALPESDSPLMTPFSLPSKIQFDERITDQPLMPHEEKSKLEHDQAVREQFRVFFNEMYAAAMVATILFEALDQNLPWGFVYDVSRHFWDECRHSEFGATRLKELGVEPDRCDQTLFENGMDMPLLHRFCYLTMILETHYMPRKKPRFTKYGEAGDERSQLFADHDWSDEINHVRLGKDWLENLLEDDARDLKQVKRETKRILENRSEEGEEVLSPF